ncbi:hypothetical protein B0H11DRAFT_1916329 [Mycena galericulata]|nr:hypothetical protein B0H11DRAFT_1916329 [Mycena galericulata]
MRHKPTEMKASEGPEGLHAMEIGAGDASFAGLCIWKCLGLNSACRKPLAIFVHATFDTRVFLQLGFKRLIHLQLSDPVRYAPYGSNPSQTHCGTPVQLHSGLPSTTEYWQTEVPPTTKPVCGSFASSSSRAELTRVIYEMCIAPASANYLTFLTVALRMPQAWYQAALHVTELSRCTKQVNYAIAPGRLPANSTVRTPDGSRDNQNSTTTRADGSGPNRTGTSPATSL